MYSSSYAIALLCLLGTGHAFVPKGLSKTAAPVKTEKATSLASSYVDMDGRVAEDGVYSGYRGNRSYRNRDFYRGYNNYGRGYSRDYNGGGYGGQYGGYGTGTNYNSYRNFNSYSNGNRDFYRGNYNGGLYRGNSYDRGLYRGRYNDYGYGYDMPGGHVMANIWENSSPIVVQGGSLRTWSFATPRIERVAVLMKTEGRPLNADVELWQGPDNCPQKLSVYVEEGMQRPFSAIFETPWGNNAIAIRNTGQMEFPLDAVLGAEADGRYNGLGQLTRYLYNLRRHKTIQGGALHTYSFDPSISSVQVMLKTDGRPLNARVELLQGPNNSKQVIDVYSEDGFTRPFYAILETPGVGNVIRVVNQATVEFPMYANVEPYRIGGRYDNDFMGDYGAGYADYSPFGYGDDQGFFRMK